MSLKGIGFVFCIGAVAFGLVGCGGGASPAANTGGGGGSPAISLGKVRLDVDLSNNTVKVVPVTDQTQPAGRAVFSGNTLTVSSATVANVPGNGAGFQLLSMQIAVNSPLYNPNLGPLNVMFQPTTGTGVRADTLAGGGASGLVDGTALLATLGHPVGSWVDTDGTIYFTQTDSGAVRKLKGGNISTITTGISGPAGITGDSNFLYVAAQNSHQIFKITKSGQTTTLLAGSGAAGLTNGTGAGATFNTPTGLAIYQNILFVADYGNNAVRTVDINSGVTSTYQIGIAGAIGVATGTLGGLPVMAVTSNTGGYVKIIGISGGSVTLGDSAGSAGVAFLPNDMVVVGNASHDTFRVLQVASNSAPLSLNSWYTVGTYGTGPGSTDGTSPTFQTPFLFGFGLGTGLIVPDNGNNKLRDLVLDPSASSGSNPCQFTNPTAYFPGQVPVYSTLPGTLNVGITSAQTQRFSLLMTVEGPTVAAIPPSQDGAVSSPTLLSIPLAGNANQYVTKATDGVGADVRFYNPIQCRVAKSGFIAINDYYCIRIADRNGRVVRITGDVVSGTTGYGYQFNPNYTIASIDMNSSGTVIILATSTNVYRLARSPGADPFTPNSWYGSLVAGTGSLGNVVGLGSVAQFNNPYLAINRNDDSASTIFVADSYNNLLKRIHLTGSDPSSATSYNVTTWSGSAGVGFADGSGGVAKMNTPQACAIGADGNFYFNDYGNYRLRMALNQDSTVVSTLAGNGTGGIVDGGPGQLTNLLDMTLAPNGAIYLLDASDGRYLRQYNQGALGTFGKLSDGRTFGIGVDPGSGDIYWGDGNFFGKLARIIN